jgi:hypothetical protein
MKTKGGGRAHVDLRIAAASWEEEREARADAVDKEEKRRLGDVEEVGRQLEV